ncbi:MAG TPA: NUDIX domain-containing protein [Anaerolineae bacterium]|nr:NUDIX domain-containing protein [Anaerolineae bacterium]
MNNIQLDSPSIPETWSGELQQVRAELAGGDTLRSQDVNDLEALWRPRLLIPEREEEQFDLIGTNGRPTGVVAPRWLCHLLGLRHWAVHVVLRSPQGMTVLQVRSRHKADWPGLLDLAVTGHVRAGQGLCEAAIAELGEELGVVLHHLTNGKLERVGEPYLRRDTDPIRPLFLNVQFNAIYKGSLTPAGMAALHFRDREVEAIYLCREEEVERIVRESTHAAPALRYSWPRYRQAIALSIYMTEGEEGKCSDPS